MTFVHTRRQSLVVSNCFCIRVVFPNKVPIFYLCRVSRLQEGNENKKKGKLRGEEAALSLFTDAVRRQLSFWNSDRATMKRSLHHFFRLSWSLKQQSTGASGNVRSEQVDQFIAETLTSGVNINQNRQFDLHVTLDCGRKQGRPEKTHTCIWRTCRLTQKHPVKDFTPSFSKHF